jgi:UDP-glucose 4-epimerase
MGWPADLRPAGGVKSGGLGHKCDFISPGAWSLMRIVITGASGNVGSALLRRLAATDDYDIVGLSRRIPHGGPGGDKVQWASVDLTKNACGGMLRDVLRGADAVVHLAWAFQPAHDLRYLEALGVGGTQRVLEAVGFVGVPHLVHMSSVGAYSPKRDNTPVDEDWPTGGVPSSPYSRHKSTAERLLDAHEQAGYGTLITRLRPGIIGQRSAGSSLLRYGVPALVPARAVGLVPVLPLDRRLSIPMVHADDVAAAIERVVQRKVPGAFNLAAPPPLTTDAIAEALGAWAVYVPVPVVRAFMALAWHARLQQVDPGWLDLGFAVPLLDTSRAERELEWSPSVDALTVLRETLSGIRERSADRTPALRGRTVLGQLGEVVRHGPVGQRQRP